MSSQVLKPKQEIQPRNLAHVILKLIAAHPDTFVTKIDNVSANWSGGPGIVPAHDDLSTINPKTRYIKQPWWHAFQAIRKGMVPVQSNPSKKKWVGQ